MSVQAIGWAYRQDVNPVGAKFVLVTIANYADERFHAWPSKARLAKDTCMSKQAVLKHLNHLESVGLISIRRRKSGNTNLTSVIRLMIDGSPEADDLEIDDGEDDWGSQPELPSGQPDSGEKVGNSSCQVGNEVGNPGCHKPIYRSENKKDICTKPTRRRISYPPGFEEFWSAYPTDSLMSKKQACAAWKKLSDGDQQLALNSLPAFTAYCRANPDYRPVHAVRYITQRRFDGFAKEAAGKPAATDDLWQTRLSYARNNRKWSPTWGPAPGATGCIVPQHLLQRGDGEGWTELIIRRETQTA